MLPERSPLRISVTGIDGSGKTTATDTSAQALGVDKKVLRGSLRSVYSIDNGEKEFHYQKLLQTVDSAYKLSERFKSKHVASGVNTLNILLHARRVEPHLTEQLQPDLVLGARDLIVDPSVYAIFYPSFISKTNMSNRLSVVERLTGLPHRDIVFFLTLPSELAIQRLQERASTEANPNQKSKFLDQHESSQTLYDLQNEYHLALAEFQNRSGADIVEINTEHLDADEVASNITGIISSYLQNPTKPLRNGAWIHLGPDVDESLDTFYSFPQK